MLSPFLFPSFLLSRSRNSCICLLVACIAGSETCFLSVLLPPIPPPLSFVNHDLYVSALDQDDWTTGI